MHVGPVDWQPLDRFKQVADVNLWGTIEVTKTFLPLVKESRGRVVNIGSLLGKDLLILIINSTSVIGYCCHIKVALRE